MDTSFPLPVPLPLPGQDLLVWSPTWNPTCLWLQIEAFHTNYFTFTRYRLDLCSRNRAECDISHIYVHEIYMLLILCFLLLNNSSCWQPTLKGGSVKAKYLNGYVFILAFVCGFFLAFSTLDCLTAVQVYGLMGFYWPKKDFFFFPSKDTVEGALGMYGGDCNRAVLW